MLGSTARSVSGFLCATTMAAAQVQHVDAAIVTTLAAGQGENLSTIQIDFTNGNGYLLEYSWSGAATSFSALQAFDALLPEFTLVFERTGFGPLVTGLGVLGDYEYGTGDLWPVVENYWHYWVKDGGEWGWAPLGAADRALFDGSWDAWVFGTPAVPQPIPTPAAAILLAGAAATVRRRRNN